jgi:uncharacterized membrane protein (UPF0127 family)
VRPHWLLLIGLVSCAACESNRPYGGDRKVGRAPRQQGEAAPRVVLTDDAGVEHPVDVEVVRTEEDKRQGLMWRRHLDADAGMLFIMGEERIHTFWMKNTYISLDMIFIAKEMRVAGVAADTVPESEELSFVERPSSFVLEVNAGWARAHGIDAGAKVRFENVDL